jgi:uncharacterized protein
MNPVVHFEFPGEDMERMKKFYETAFGWKLQQLGAEMGDYVVAHSAETDENQMVKKPGQINGGFYKKSPEKNTPSVVIAVEDIKEGMEKVKAAGGTITDGPTDIPGVGIYSGFIDTEGNKIAMLQPKGMGGM